MIIHVLLCFYLPRLTVAVACSGERRRNDGAQADEVMVPRERHTQQVSDALSRRDGQPDDQQTADHLQTDKRAGLRCNGLRRRHGQGHHATRSAQRKTEYLFFIVIYFMY